MQMIGFVFIGFLAFLFVVLMLCSKLLRSDKARRIVPNTILLVASYIFVLYADVRFAIVLALLTIVTWLCAKSKKAIGWGVTAAILALAYFKYTNFFAESFAKLLGNDFNALKIIMPLGISFYTFSAISYLVDVRRGKTEVRSLFDVALYLSFFPKITSGPIQRSSDFFKQMDSDRKVDFTTLSEGVQIFAFGLFKKIVVADRLSVFVNQVYETPNAFSSFTVFFAVLAYSLQIYFDFSGYSDIAIGSAKVLGFNLPRNFNLPYLAHNVTELWKRWHMTLSSWLMEYVYFSFGGNRKGRLRTYVNLILTMLLGGIWHGANWTYIFWGLLHGVALAVHKVYMDTTGSAKKVPSKVGGLISTCITFLFVTFCWIFFRAESITKAFMIIGRIFSFEAGLTQIYTWMIFAIIVFIVGAICAYIHSKNVDITPKKLNVSLVDGYYPMVDLSTFRGLLVFFIFCGMILALAHTGGSPFIYGNY